jgi:hypothetical protein
MGQGLARFPENVFFPIVELLLEVFKLTLVHEGLVLGGTILQILDLHRGRLH